MSRRSRKSNNHIPCSGPNPFLCQPWLSYSLMCKVLETIIFTISFHFLGLFERLCYAFFKFLIPFLCFFSKSLFYWKVFPNILYEKFCRKYLYCSSKTLGAIFFGTFANAVSIVWLKDFLLHFIAPLVFTFIEKMPI